MNKTVIVAMTVAWAAIAWLRCLPRSASGRFELPARQRGSPASLLVTLAPRSASGGVYWLAP